MNTGDVLRSPDDRRHQVGWSIERILLVLTFTFSTLAFVFGVGFQAARTVAIEARLTALTETAVNKEVYVSDQRALAASIDRLSRSLELIVEREVAYANSKTQGR